MNPPAWGGIASKWRIRLYLARPRSTVGGPWRFKQAREGPLMAVVADTSPPALPALRPRGGPRPPRPLAPTPAPLVSTVIVNFRQWENTVALTNQLDAADCMRAGQAEVVLIDNDPDPHPLRRCVRSWAGVSLRCFNRNRGFARAVNEGCRRARGQWLLLLNPDVRVPEEFLDRVLGAA